MKKISKGQIQEIAKNIEKLEGKNIAQFEENLAQAISDNVNWAKLLGSSEDDIDQQLDVVYQVMKNIMRKRFE